MVVWTSPGAHHPFISSPGHYSSLSQSLDAAQRRLWALVGVGDGAGWSWPSTHSSCHKSTLRNQSPGKTQRNDIWLVSFTVCPAIIYSQNLLNREELPPLYR